MNDFNDRVIAEFRANGGVVENFGSSLVLLHSIGARSGTARISPIMSIAQPDGSVLIAASKAGAPDNPAWYFNLLAQPSVTIEIDTRTIVVTAKEVTGSEYDGAWAQFTSRSPGFAEYQVRADSRRIPVIRLVPRD